MALHKYATKYLHQVVEHDPPVVQGVAKKSKHGMRRLLCLERAWGRDTRGADSMVGHDTTTRDAFPLR